MLGAFFYPWAEPVLPTSDSAEDPRSALRQNANDRQDNTVTTAATAIAMTKSFAKLPLTLNEAILFCIPERRTLKCLASKYEMDLRVCGGVAEPRSLSSD